MTLTEIVQHIYSKHSLIGNQKLNEKVLNVINTQAKKAVDLLVENGSSKLTPIANMIVALSVVNYAKKWNVEDESKFTKYITLQYGYRDDTGRIWNLIAGCIQKAMVSNGKLFVKDGGGRQFVETVLAHSLGPLNEWDPVFDFLLDYLKTNLRWDFIKGDPINQTMVHILKNRFDGIEDDEEELQIGSGKYYIRIGARKIVQHDPECAVELFEMIIARINSIINGANPEAKTYIDTLIDNWHVRKLNTMMTSEKVHMVSARKVHTETALSYSKIRAQYKIAGNNLTVITPAIRLDNSEVQKAEEIIYLADKEFRRIPLEIYGNELGKTINQCEVSLKEIGNNHPRISVKIVCDGREIYDSGRTLYRKLIAFKNNREVGLNSLKCDEYLLYIPEFERIEFENIEVDKINPHICKVRLEKDFTIKQDNRTISMDTSTIQQARILEPETVQGVQYEFEGTMYDLIRESESLRILFDVSKNTNYLRLNINGKDVSVENFKDKTEKDICLINIELESIACVNSIVKLVLADIQSEEILYKRLFYLCSAFEMSFNRKIYVKAEDFDAAELTLKMGTDKQSISFDNNSPQITIPYQEGNLIFAIPCVKSYWSGIDMMYPGNKIWHSDVLETTCLHVENHSDRTVLVDVGSKLFKGNTFEIGKILKENFQNASFNIPIVLVIDEERYEIGQIICSEMFIQNPVFTFEDKCLYWSGGHSFIGSSHPDLELILFQKEEIKYSFPLVIGVNRVEKNIDFFDGDYTYQIINHIGNEDVVVAQDVQFFGNPNRIRFQNKIIEIEEVTEDIEDGGRKMKIKPVYIDNIRFIKHAYVPSEDGAFDIYEGRMYFIKPDGSKRYFSSKYFEKNIAGRKETYYQINPVQIIYINEQFIRVINPDEEGILCFYNFGTTPSHEITDREPIKNAKNYKDILFYLYKVRDEHTTAERSIIAAKNLPVQVSSNNAMFSKFECVSQESIINSLVNTRIAINAGPGTGKTYTLIERIINLVNEQEIDPEEILVLCFSRAAVEVIRQRLTRAYEQGRVNETINYVDVRTFDSFASQVLYWVKESESNFLEHYNISSLNYEERIELFNSVLRKEPELISQCSHLFVDEIQDLVKSRARMVLNMIDNLPKDCGITLFGDSCQSIYDYQVNEDVMSSLQFYKNLVERRSNFSYYSLARNYRQDSELALTGDLYRNCILEGNTKKCDQMWNSTVGSFIQNYEVHNFEKITSDSLRYLTDKGTVGILARTNGQALKISSLLREKGIEHGLKKRLSDASLCAWLGYAINNYQYMSIDYDDFEELLKKYDQVDAEKAWADIVECMRGVSGRIGIREMLRSILMSAKGNSLYIRDMDCPLMVTNIHRGKGREFDTVLVEDSIFGEQQKSMEEHKVCYVAVTRPKSAIFKICTNIHYIRIDKEGDRRCYETKFGDNGKKLLSYIEVGFAADVEKRSSVRMKDVQQYLRNIGNEIKGEKVVLIKESYSNGYVSYRIHYPKGNLDLGRTSMNFSESLERALRDIYNLPSRAKVYFDLFPRRLTDVYVDEVISVIDETDGSECGITTYGEMMVWNTISIVGYAKAEYI